VIRFVLNPSNFSFCWGRSSRGGQSGGTLYDAKSMFNAETHQEKRRKVNGGHEDGDGFDIEYSS